MHSPSITIQGKNEPFELQVARGFIEGHRTATVFGAGFVRGNLYQLAAR